MVIGRGAHLKLDARRVTQSELMINGKFHLIEYQHHRLSRGCVCDIIVICAKLNSHSQLRRIFRVRAIKNSNLCAFPNVGLINSEIYEGCILCAGELYLKRCGQSLLT
jgi:hypothetical protein